METETFQNAADPFVRALKEAHALVQEAHAAVQRALDAANELTQSQGVDKAIAAPTLSRLALSAQGLSSVCQTVGRAHLAAKLAGRDLGVDVVAWGATGPVPAALPASEPEHGAERAA